MFRYEFLYPFLSVLAFATYPSLSKLVLQNNSSLVVLCLSSFLAYIIIVIVQYALRAKSESLLTLTEKREAVFIALLKSTISPLLYMIGLTQSSVINMVVMKTMETPVNAVLSSYYLGEKMGRWYWIGSLILYAGIVAFITEFFQIPLHFTWADLIFLIAALSNAVGDILFKKYAVRYPLMHFLEQRSFVAGVSMVIAIGAVVLSGYQESIHVAIDATAVGLLVAIAIVPLILAQYFWHAAIPHASLCNLVLVSALYIIIAPLVAYFLLGETMSLSQIASAGIILFGLLVSHFHARKNASIFHEHHTM